MGRVTLKSSDELKVERWERMENFNKFLPMLKEFLGEIYGSPERGLQIYQSRYKVLDYYKNYRARPNSYLLVAKFKGEPVGWLYGRKRKEGGYVYDLFVKKEFRGKGIGRKLIEAFEKQVGLPLTAETHSKALEAFKALGFKPKRSYFEDGVEWFFVEKS